MAGPMAPKRSDMTPAPVRPMALPTRAVSRSAPLALPRSPVGNSSGP